MSRSPIEVVDLRKEYGGFTAVDNLSLSIRKNSFTGLLGPNGAGKSTTLKILTHLINATSGEAYLNGIDVTKDPKGALRKVGTVVETPEFYAYLTPRKTLKYIGEIIGMTPESISSETDEILEKVKMTEWADKKIGTFSKGMRQRIALGQSLLDNPDIIILDEPTSGLDPRGMAEIREILKNLRRDSDGLTIVMSSHILHEVSDLCDRVALINHGKLILDDDISAVTAADGIRKMTVRTIGVPDEDMMDRMASLDNVVSVERMGNDMDVTIKGDGEIRTKFFSDVNGLDIGAYSISEDDSLEATYLRLIKESG